MFYSNYHIASRVNTLDNMHYNVLKLLFVAVELTPNRTVIIAYSIATCSNCMLN